MPARMMIVRPLPIPFVLRSSTHQPQKALPMATVTPQITIAIQKLIFVTTVSFMPRQ